MLYARINHPLGPLDVFTTHLSSSADFGTSSCDININVLPGIPVSRPCPDACNAAGATTVRQCQAVQLAQRVAMLHDVSTPAVITGDFNAPSGTFEYLQFTGRGYVDVYLQAGNPECDPATGIGCTSGRESRIAALQSPDTMAIRVLTLSFSCHPQRAGRHVVSIPRPMMTPMARPRARSPMGQIPLPCVVVRTTPSVGSRIMRGWSWI